MDKANFLIKLISGSEANVFTFEELPPAGSQENLGYYAKDRLVFLYSKGFLKDWLVVILNRWV